MACAYSLSATVLAIIRISKLRFSSIQLDHLPIEFVVASIVILFL